MLGAGSFFCFCLGPTWLGRVLKAKWGPFGGTGSSLARRVFRLGDLWWPKSLTLQGHSYVRHPSGHKGHFARIRPGQGWGVTLKTESLAQVFVFLAV